MKTQTLVFCCLLDKMWIKMPIWTIFFKSSKEFNASHILVKEEQQAFEILKKLENNAKFSDLAKTQSIGPSGKNEGKLGWFTSGQMVKEFEKAVLSLKKGEITKKPVKTKFGFHIILLNEVRDSKPKKLSEVQQNIINRIKKNSLSNIRLADSKMVRHFKIGPKTKKFYSYFFLYTR